MQYPLFCKEYESKMLNQLEPDLRPPVSDCEEHTAVANVTSIYTLHSFTHVVREKTWLAESRRLQECWISFDNKPQKKKNTATNRYL